jgi:hypothetical protein
MSLQFTRTTQGGWVLSKWSRSAPIGGCADQTREPGNEPFRIRRILTSRGWLAKIDPALAAAVVRVACPRSLAKGDLLSAPTTTRAESSEWSRAAC